MRLQTIAIMLIFAIASFSANAKAKKEAGLKIGFVVSEKDKKVDVMIDGKLFTSYIWPDNVMKPVLYPVMTSEGTEITRGYPLKPRAGERVDHPHHAVSYTHLRAHETRHDL